MRPGVMVLAVGVSALAACGGDMAVTGAASASSAAVAPVNDAASLASGVAGVLVDEAGAPLADARILACMSSVCLFGQTGPNGRFQFEIDAPAELVIKTSGDASGLPRRAAAMRPVKLSDARLVDVGAVYAPELLHAAPIGPAGRDPQTIDAGDGLELILNRAQLTPRLGDAIVDLAARRLPADYLPAYSKIAGAEVLAVYALHPFAVRSAGPIAVRAPLDLPDGTPVAFRTVDEIDGHLSDPVPGRSAGGFVTTDPSTGVNELTHLVISR